MEVNWFLTTHYYIAICITTEFIRLNYYEIKMLVGFLLLTDLLFGFLTDLLGQFRSVNRFKHWSVSFYYSIRF